MKAPSPGGSPEHGGQGTDRALQSLDDARGNLATPPSSMVSCLTDTISAPAAFQRELIRLQGRGLNFVTRAGPQFAQHR